MVKINECPFPYKPSLLACLFVCSLVLFVDCEHHLSRCGLLVLVGATQTHNLTTSPSTTIEATKTDLMDMFETMYTMRRMEITCVSRITTITCMYYSGWIENSSLSLCIYIER